MKFDLTSVSALSRENGIQAYGNTIKEINDATLPILRNYLKLLDGDKAATKACGETNRALSGSVTTPWPKAVIKVLEHHVKRESDIEALIESVVPKNIDVEQLDSRSVQIGQYIDTLSFFSTYTRNLVIMEIDGLAKSRNMKLTPVQSSGERQDVIKNFAAYRAAFVQVSQQTNVDIVKTVKEMPDYVVSAADIATLNATYGSAKASPLSQNFFSADWNPIFKIRTAFNNALIKRYHVAKEQRQNLEFTIAALEGQRTGEHNPALEQELEYHTGRLKRLNTELKKIEEDAK